MGTLTLEYITENNLIRDWSDCQDKLFSMHCVEESVLDDGATIFVCDCLSFHHTGYICSHSLAVRCLLEGESNHDAADNDGDDDNDDSGEAKDDGSSTLKYISEPMKKRKRSGRPATTRGNL